MKTYKLHINGEKYEARILEYSSTHAKVNVNGHDYLIQIDDEDNKSTPFLAAQEKAVPIAPAFFSSPDGLSGEIRSPIPGVIVSIKVKEGDRVSRGQTILILEAMKMESEIAAPIDGIIKKILVKERAPVQEGDLMITIETEDRKKEAPKTISSSKDSRPPKPEAVSAPKDSIIRAPIPGIIIDVLVQPGDEIDEDSVVLILEAMKMESEIHSTLSGKVSKIHTRRGDSVLEGDPLIEVEIS